MIAIYVAMALVVGWFTIEGVRQGVIRRLIEVLGLIVVFLFASRLAGDLEPVLHDSWGMPARTAFFTSWVVVIVGGLVSVRLLAKLSQKIVRLTIAGWLDRIGGGVLGAAFGAVLASCLMVVVLIVPVEDDFKREIRDDPISGVVLNIAPAVYDVARTTWDGESFFEMIREHVEPAAKDAAEQIRAAVEEIEREYNDEPGQ